MEVNTCHYHKRYYTIFLLWREFVSWIQGSRLSRVLYRTLLGWGVRVGHYFRVQYQVVDSIVKPLAYVCHNHSNMYACTIINWRITTLTSYSWM